MTKFDKIITAIALPIAVGTCVMEPMEPMTPVVWATASRQPALVSDQAASRLAPTGFDQAQGSGR